MIHSMTGYAAASRDLGSAVLNLELKSVNSRYLDIGFRLGEDLRFLEMPLRERIAERIAREAGGDGAGAKAVDGDARAMLGSQLPCQVGGIAQDAQGFIRVMEAHAVR